MKTIRNPKSAIRNSRNPQSAIRNTQSEIEEIPKIELHVHLEGSITPQQLRSLSKKYGTSLAGPDRPDPVAELYRFQTFAEFLNAYKICCQHLQTPEDYAWLAGSLLQRLADEHCVYAEVLLTPSICTRFGLPSDEVIDAVLDRAAGAARSGLMTRWVLDTVRQWGPDPCWQTLETAMRFKNSGVVGICIGGDEASEPARAFRDIFEAAEKAGLHRTAHAGEVGDARSVWQAIEELRAERIGHGIHALEDPKLVEYLIQHNLPLDISITSNFRTGAADTSKTHPIRQIAERGIAFTLNSDDPGLFQTTLQQEWELAAQILGWSAEDFLGLMRKTVQYTFLGEEERKQIARLLM
ncbi:MAG TPA: adenosine deaminase [Acidobacteriota bacterium]|jgi:adenosine deaminase|nr:adenosine deaminase [Acidobacteriota bacterium]